MGKAISYSERQIIIEAHLKGEFLTKIAERLERDYECVRSIWRRYQKDGDSGLAPHYRNCGKKHQGGFNPLAVAHIEELKRGNALLGAPYLRSVTLAKFPNSKVPNERTVQRWWIKSGENPPKSQQPKQNHNWTKEVHHTWQMDAKEQTLMGDGEKICWLTVADEGSSSLLGAPVFGVERISQVDPFELKKN